MNLSRLNSNDILIIDPQEKLLKAFENRDIQEFRAALEAGANASTYIFNEIQDTYPQNCLEFVTKYLGTVFGSESSTISPDVICEPLFLSALKTSGCSEFVRECLLFGCDPNFKDQEETFAIFYVLKSYDSENLKELLTNSSEVDVNCKEMNLTPLNYLAKHVNSENFDNVIECIKLLLNYGASPYLSYITVECFDEDIVIEEHYPINTVLENTDISDAQKQNIIELLVNKIDFDIDNVWFGDLRRKLELLYPSLQLPKMTETRMFQFLMNYIENEKNDLFILEYLYKSKEIGKYEQLLLFAAVIRHKFDQGFDIIMANGVDYNHQIPGPTSPFEGEYCVNIALLFGNAYALKNLVDQPDINEDTTALITVVHNIDEEDVCFKTSEHWNCFKILLNSNKFNIYQSARSALHFAAINKKYNVAKELLKSGTSICASITIIDLYVYNLLRFLGTSIFEEHFNDCISTPDYTACSKIKIDLKNFKSSEDNFQRRTEDILTTIAYLTESKEQRDLLKHPVITTILFIQWQTIAPIFYINFLLFSFFAISFCSFSVLKFRFTEYEIAKTVAYVWTWLGIAYLIIRECLQIFVSRLKYFTEIFNYSEILLIILSIETCIPFYKDPDVEKKVAVTGILLLSYQLFLFVGSIPVASISTYMLMLESVFKSFIKCFLLYSIFIITFTLCFFIQNEEQNEIDKMKGNEESNNDLDKFPDPLAAFTKIMVMFTGEFDASSLKLDSSFSYLLFLSFVFFMTIILFNLLNGLAVSDTQAIREQSELNDIICRTNLLSRYNNFWFNNDHLLKISKKYLSDYTTVSYICIYIEINNLVEAYDEGNEGKILRFRMDQQTVDRALKILQNKFLQKKKISLEQIFKRVEDESLRNQTLEEGNQRIEKINQEMEEKLKSISKRLYDNGYFQKVELKLDKILKRLDL